MRVVAGTPGLPLRNLHRATATSLPPVITPYTPPRPSGERAGVRGQSQANSEPKHTASSDLVTPPTLRRQTTLNAISVESRPCEPLPAHPDCLCSTFARPLPPASHPSITPYTPPRPSGERAGVRGRSQANSEPKHTASSNLVTPQLCAARPSLNLLARRPHEDGVGRAGRCRRTRIPFAQPSPDHCHQPPTHPSRHTRPLAPLGRGLG